MIELKVMSIKLHMLGGVEACNNDGGSDVLPWDWGRGQDDSVITPCYQLLIKTYGEYCR